MLWFEVGGAAVLAVVLVMVFAGGKGGEPPRTASETPPRVSMPAPQPVPVQPPRSIPAQAPGPAPRELRPPGRPAPRVDLAPGEVQYGAAEKLWDEAVALRQKGDAATARKKLHEAYLLLQKAMASVDDFNQWDEEADMKSWALDAEASRTKASIGRWFNLQARIHKILPNQK